MQTRRIRTLHKIITLLLIITILSFTVAGAFGALYLREVREVSRLQSEKEQYQKEQFVKGAASLHQGRFCQRYLQM